MLFICMHATGIQLTREQNEFPMQESPKERGRDVISYCIVQKIHRSLPANESITMGVGLAGGGASGMHGSDVHIYQCLRCGEKVYNLSSYNSRLVGM